MKKILKAKLSALISIISYYQYLIEDKNGSPTHPQRTDDIAVELKPLDRCLKTSIPHPCTHRYDETLSPFVPHQFANWVFN